MFYRAPEIAVLNLGSGMVRSQSLARVREKIAGEPLEFIFLLQGLKKAIRWCVMYCQEQEALRLSESERTPSEEPRAAVSVCQTMGVLDTAYGILYDFLREKHRRYDARLAVIDPSLKLLAFGMNHIGVLGDDAKKGISEQAAALSRQGNYSHSTAIRILRTHLSIALHSFNALSVNVRKRHPSLL